MTEININWLYAKGWTVRQASKAINRSYSHVAYVLRGERQSLSIIRELKKLPSRSLHFRDSLPVSGKQLLTFLTLLENNMTTPITFAPRCETDMGCNVNSMMQHLVELLNDVLPPESDDLRRTLNAYLKDVAADLHDMDVALDDTRSNYMTADEERDELRDKCQELKSELADIVRLYTAPHLESDLAQALADARQCHASYINLHVHAAEKLLTLLTLINTVKSVDDECAE